ncbi:MAG: 3'-5' exonuclease [Lentisphaeria bacterium]
MKQLPLKRPLVVLDLETTGINPRYDRIIEIAAVKLHPDGRRESWVRRINPQRAIPAGSTAVHGITDADVAAAPIFPEIAFDLQRFLLNCDFAGFGVIKFDLPMLSEEFRRCDLTFAVENCAVLDAQRIFHMREPRTLSAALRLYCGKEHTGAHGAEADVLATIEVIEGQFERYADLPHDLAELDRLCQQRQDDSVDAAGKLRWRGDDVIINFGQKSGATLRDLAAGEPSYLKWILQKDFAPEVKELVREALAGRFPRRPAPPAPAITPRDAD